jgi:prolipoprotein diacylglyceryltransferase
VHISNILLYGVTAQRMEHKVDLYAIFIFLGIVQALFLCLFFFSKQNRKVDANFFQRLMVLAIAACSLEILLCYTGFISNVQ